jgi:hypothetical protein
MKLIHLPVWLLSGFGPTMAKDDHAAARWQQQRRLTAERADS